MDSKGKRRWLALAVFAFSGWAFLRRPSIVLVILTLLYLNAEKLLGIVPLRPYGLGEWISDRPEVAIGAAGIVVAVASMLAFKRVKRLDLELVVGTEIAVILKDAMEMVSRTREYCSDIDCLKSILMEVGSDPPPSPQRAIERMEMLKIRWDMLLEDIPQLRVDQEKIWNVPSRIDDLFTMHGVVLRSKVVAPLLLTLSNRYSIVVARNMRLLLPRAEDEVAAFLDRLDAYKGVSVADFRKVDVNQVLKFAGCMGGASSLGTSSIVPPSAVTVAALAVKLWRI